MIRSQARDEPRLLLCRDEEHLHVGLSLPTQFVPNFRGHFTARDAAGAVDGVKDGKYGFHTWRTPDPWWQVDLGQSQSIRRIVVYNRLDYAPGLHNADHIVILTSDDEQNWQQFTREDPSSLGSLGEKLREALGSKKKK